MPSALLAELPDLWDVNVADWKNDSLPSRFGQEGFQEEYIRFVKKVTTKPVVGVGRFTSPDTMVRQIKSGVMDLIGAARPSIADPFLPYKIDNGLVDEIRECIGCNMCTSGDTLATPMRCTQNPTMGEEWRSGWHPMRIDKRHANEKVLVVGAGPAGLEATLALSNRGYDVTLSEAGEELGGRVLRESSLPSLREWRRVADHRAHMLASRAGVEIFTQSHLSVEDVLSVGCEHVAIATGSRWRDDLIGREHRTRPNIDPQCRIITPDDIMAGERPRGRVLIFDDDHYYMANVIAELLVAEGCAVTFVTPAADISTWSHNTLEHEHVKTRLLRSGVKLACNRMIREVKLGGVVLECPYTGNKEQIETDAFIAVTSRIPEDGLYRQLLANADRWQETGLKSLTAIGDCYAPATIAISVQAGHRYARELGSGEGIGVLRREVSFGGE
ncbi:FAD-dependent oxidoreductase [Mesorhizobium sp.]|uniref:FAD-dependent oxidoreductase n=1 Tax=Mesorhizobium sp. TaxID=1871066 RepID=UPI0025F6D25F|nr:FAD-dependent oxidoreductase [Mesorhizobium sp.]